MDEEDLDTLTADFSRLRSSIAAELRRVGGAPEERPATAFSSVLAEKHSALPPPPPPVVQPPPANPPPQAPPATLADDEVVPTFYSLRENLLGKVSSSAGAQKAPPTCSVRTPSEPNTVHMVAQPPQQMPGASGGLGDGLGDSMSAEFNALRASITAQLRNATAEGMGAAAGGFVPPSAATMDDDEDDDEMPPPPKAPPAPYTAASSAPTAPQGGSVFLQRAFAQAGPPPFTAAAVQQPGSNTVLLSARKPTGVDGPGCVTAMDPRSAIAAARSNAPGPGGRASGPFPAPVSMPPSGPPLTAVPDGPPERVQVRASSVDGDGASATIASYPNNPSRDVVFGHLAFKAAIESHRLNYEAKRAKIPMVAQFRPTSGNSVKPVPAPGRVDGGSGKPPSKPRAPNLHTAARARPKPEAAWAETMNENASERLKAAAVTGAQIKSEPVKKGPGGKVTPKIPITRPKSAGGVVSMRSSGGGGGGGGGILPGNNAPLMPVTNVGVAPTLETIRNTERLVAQVAQSARTMDDGDDGREGGAPPGPQYTEGAILPPMTAQQAWASAAEGEARQQAIMSGMAAQTADMLRKTQERVANIS